VIDLAARHVETNDEDARDVAADDDGLRRYVVRERFEHGAQVGIDVAVR
jgi:hypothetical protein